MTERKIEVVNALTNRLRIVQGWIEDIEAGEHDENANPVEREAYLHELQDRQDEIFRQLIGAREELGIPTGQPYQ